MAQDVNGTIKSFKAASGSVPAYRIAVLTAGNTVGVTFTSTSVIVGITTNDASATGQAVGVCLNGTAKCTCGASVSAGALLTAATDTGKCIDATSVLNTTTTVIPRTIGIALQTGSTNSVIEVAIIPNNVRVAIA